MPIPPLLLGPVHHLLLAAYLTAPLLAFALATYRYRVHKSAAGYVSLAGVLVTALILSLALCLIFATMGSGRLIPTQVALGTYFAAALLLLLRAFDKLLLRLFTGPALPDRRKPARLRLALGLTLRGVLLVALGLPWIMSAVMTYRPKVAPAEDPLAQANWPYEAVSFPATDGSQVSAWFIPAPPSSIPGAVPPHPTSDIPHPTSPAPSPRTVILVHGLGSNKGNQLFLARQLVPAGFNVLAIDLRAHGGSAGQLATLGLTERHDVLGAVRYLTERRPDQSRQIFGLGASQGAAALIAAATDNTTPELHALALRIDALAVYGTFADAGDLMTSIRRSYLPGPVGYLFESLALPFAELHAGVPLRRFAPADTLPDLWPRPILILHGTKDEIIPPDQGRQLFNHATPPKSALWIEGTHTSILGDEPAATEVRRFFENAMPVPVI